MPEEKEIIRVRDIDGIEKDAEVIFSFEHTETHKTYIVYTFNEIEEQEMARIYAANVIATDGKIAFNSITDKEWNSIKNIMRKLVNMEG